MATDTSNFNFQGIGVVGAISIHGCRNSLAINYDPSATVDDGSCILPILGCMDPTACNFVLEDGVNQDDGSCEYTSCVVAIYGCIDPLACNYDPLALTDDGSCVGQSGCTDPTQGGYNASNTCDCNGDVNGTDHTCCLGLLGCMDSTASNYNSLALVDDGSCIPCVYGCTDCGTIWETTNSATCPGGAATSPGSINFDPSATCDNLSCSAAIYGCTDPLANNYNSNANVDDGNCTYTISGCTDPLADQGYDPNANVDDGSCVYLGCDDPTACNYDAAANANDGSCIYPAGCNDPLYLEYVAGITCPNNLIACVTLIVDGCTNALACNYDPLATADDGSCLYVGAGCGCMDTAATNYDSTAAFDDGTCEYCYNMNIAVDITTTDNTNAWTQQSDGNGTVTFTPSFGAVDLPYSYSFVPTTYFLSGQYYIQTVTSGSATYSNGLIGDTYIVTITTASGCTVTDSFTIVDNLAVSGCMDPNACNYNPSAIIYDVASCYYATPIVPSPLGTQYIDTGIVNYYSYSGGTSGNYNYQMNNQLTNTPFSQYYWESQYPPITINGNPACSQNGNGVEHWQKIYIQTDSATYGVAVTFDDPGDTIDDVIAWLNANVGPGFTNTQTYAQVQVLLNSYYTNVTHALKTPMSAINCYGCA